MALFVAIVSPWCAVALSSSNTPGCRVSAWQSATLLPISCKSVQQPVPATIASEYSAARGEHDQYNTPCSRGDGWENPRLVLGSPNERWLKCSSLNIDTFRDCLLIKESSTSLACNAFSPLPPFFFCFSGCFDERVPSVLISAGYLLAKTKAHNSKPSLAFLGNLRRS